MAITPLPTPPQRGEAPEDFANKGNALLGSLPQFVAEANALGVAINSAAAEAESSAQDAADQVVLAADQVVLAADQVVLAADQADRSRGEADRSEQAADRSETAINYRGRWEDAAGSATAGGTYEHDERLWLLLDDVPDIAQVVPLFSSPHWMLSAPRSLVVYDLSTADATSSLDLSMQQVFRVDASVPRTLTFSNPPDVGRAMTVVVVVSGDSPVTWPSGINWDGDFAPYLDKSRTTIVLFWDGEIWSGITGATFND